MSYRTRRGGVRRSQSRRATPRPHGGQIEEAAARVCVRTAYPRVAAHTEGGGRTDGRAGGRAGGREPRRVSRSLLRSSNEESSRVPARRSARSVSTRPAIGQHRESESARRCHDASSSSLHRPRARGMIESTDNDHGDTSTRWRGSRTRGVDRFLVFARVIDRDQQCYARYCEPTPRGLAERSSEMSRMPLRYSAVCARLRVLLASFRISSLREILRFDRVLLPSCLLPAPRGGAERNETIAVRPPASRFSSARLRFGSASPPRRRCLFDGRSLDRLDRRIMLISRWKFTRVTSLCERHVPAGRIIPLILISPM